MLTQDLVRELFDYRDGELLWRATMKVAGTDHLERNGKTRRVIRLNGRGHYSYRLVYLWHHGTMPRSIDHADRNQLNDRIENLRAATRSQQRANSVQNRNNTSGFRGVYLHKPSGKWQARICADKRPRSLGLFDSALEAARVYNVAALAAFGAFAVLNGRPQ